MLLDMTMPVMNGDEVYRKLREIQPEVRVVIASGHGESEVLPRFPENGVQFVQKPYRFDELANVLRQALAS